MSNNRSSKFVPPVRSIADLKSMRQIQQAVNSLLNARIQPGKTNQIHYSDSNVIYEIAAQSTQTINTIIPFTVYQITSNQTLAIFNIGTGYTVGDILTLSGGTPAAINGAETQITVSQIGQNGSIIGYSITVQGNYSVQPTYPNLPTGGSGNGAQFVQTASPTDDWRTFQVRDGLVGWRPRYPNFYTNSLPSNFIQNGASLLAQGNMEYALWVQQDDAYLSNADIFDPIYSRPNPQPFVNTGNAIVLNNNNPVLISGYDDAGNFVKWGQIVLNSDFMEAGNSDFEIPYAGFWLEITDDPAKGFYANLMAQMVGVGPGWPRSGNAFPVGKNIVPLAFVTLQNATFAEGFNNPNPNVYYLQYQSGNLMNRFAPSAGSSAMYYRGAWNVDGLSGQLFYPGDMVIDDTHTVAYTLGTAYSVWVYTGAEPGTFPEILPNGFNIETDSPLASGGTQKWIQIGITFAIPQPLP